MNEARKDGELKARDEAKIEDLPVEDADSDRIKGGLWNQPGLKSSE